MSEKRRKPTERQKNCSYSFPYMGENFDKVYCSKKVEDDIVAVTDCSQRLKSWGSQNLMENNIHLDMFRLRTNLRN